MTIRDLSVYEGPDADGDGLGVEYTNWDEKSSTLCNCDAGLFGPDCSLGKLSLLF